MRLLLQPRTAQAYGQDCLAQAVREACGLTPWLAASGLYPPPDREPTLVVSMNPEGMADAAFVERLPRAVPVVAHVHCRHHYCSAVQQGRLASVLARTAVGIVTAEFHREEMRGLFPGVDWRVVHNGVDPERFRPSTDRERGAFRRALDVDEEQHLVLFTGRLEPAKGLQILRCFCEQLARTELALLIQYPANSPEAVRQYAEVAEALSRLNPSRIRLHPDRNLGADRPVRFCDALLLPSLSEVAPLVVLESLASGVPALGTQATPFYRELPTLGVPRRFFHFVALPPGLELARSALCVSEEAASSIAAELLARAESGQSPSADERAELSRSAADAGLVQSAMLDRLRAIYAELDPARG